MIALFAFWQFFLAVLLLLALAVVLGLLASRDPRVRALGDRLEVLGWRRSARGAWGLFRDRQTPLALRLVCVPLGLYLLLPFDLIPDFIPVLGYADDLVVVALAAWLVVQFTPPAVIDRHFPSDDRGR